MKKLTFSELRVIEKKYSLWEHTLLGYPLWIHCREPLCTCAIMATRKITYPTVFEMFKSVYMTIKFLFSQKRYSRVYFLMERAEILEIYRTDNTHNKLLFLNREQENVYEKNDYISSDFFNVLRLLSRKIAYILFYKKYRDLMKKLKLIGYDEVLNSYVKTALGEAFFLKFLSLVLSQDIEKYYSGCIIPPGEKFLNRLNSNEVQHGVIHSEHIGYIGVPEVKNNLVLYAQRYKEVLNKLGYKGNLIIIEYKKSFFLRETKRFFPIVIYTQPLLKMQEGINHFFQHYKPRGVYIQKHPKDYFEYDIPAHYFVTATIPKEVGAPIVYTSSIIENFTLYDRTCYIYDISEGEFDLVQFLKIYTEGSSSKLVVKTDIKEIYKLIQKGLDSNHSQQN